MLDPSGRTLQHHLDERALEAQHAKNRCAENSTEQGVTQNYRLQFCRTSRQEMLSDSCCVLQ